MGLGPDPKDKQGTIVPPDLETNLQFLSTVHCPRKMRWRRFSDKQNWTVDSKNFQFFTQNISRVPQYPPDLETNLQFLFTAHCPLSSENELEKALGQKELDSAQ